MIVVSTLLVYEQWIWMLALGYGTLFRLFSKNWEKEKFHWRQAIDEEEP
jgi:hypothetical protein